MTTALPSLTANGKKSDAVPFPTSRSARSRMPDSTNVCAMILSGRLLLAQRAETQWD